MVVKHDFSVQMWTFHATPCKTFLFGIEPTLTGVEGWKMAFVCRAGHFIQFLAKKYFCNLNPSTSMGWRIASMTVLCKSAHFTQFHARGFSKHPKKGLHKSLYAEGAFQNTHARGI